MRDPAPSTEGSWDPRGVDALAELLDALPSLVAYVDADGVNRYVNSASRQWLRRPAERVVGSHVRELLGEEGYRATQSQLEAASRGERQEFERVFLTADGQVTHAVTTYLPRLRDGRPDGFFELTADATSRARAESAHLEATVRSAELEQRNSEAAAVSDDALQQLYAIGLHLDRLQRHPERLQDDVEPVLSSLQRTITGLRASITGMLLAGGPSSTAGVVSRLVTDWAAKTGTAAMVVVDPAVDGLRPGLTRHLLTILSQILSTAARHGAGPVHVRVLTDGRTESGSRRRARTGRWQRARTSAGWRLPPATTGVGWRWTSPTRW